MDLMSLMLSGMLPSTQGSFGATPTPDMGVMRAMQQMRPIRMMEMMNRQQSFGRGLGGGSNPFGSEMSGSMNEPDYSAASFDPEAKAAADKALSPYGLHPLDPSQVQHNALLPNTGFFGRHTRLAGGIEGALFAAANTRPSNTPGEGISNAAQGLLAGTMQRRGMLNRQFEAPFRQASMMEQLRDMHQKGDLQESEIQHYRAMDEHLKNADDQKAQYDNDRIAATRPVPDATGTWVFNKGGQTPVGMGSNPMRMDMQNTPEGWSHQDLGGRPAPGSGSLTSQMGLEKFGERPSKGKPNSKGLSGEQWADGLNKWMQGNKVEVAGASAGRSEGARLAADKKAGIDKSDAHKQAEWELKNKLSEFNKKDYRDEVYNNLWQSNGYKKVPSESDIDSEIQKHRDTLNDNFNQTWGPQTPQGASTAKRRVIDLTGK